MKYLLLLFLLYFSINCQAQVELYDGSYGDSIVHPEIDSLEYKVYMDSIVYGHEDIETFAERRVNYYVAKLGSKEKFEAFYGRTEDSFKEALIEEFKNFERRTGPVK